MTNKSAANRDFADLTTEEIITRAIGAINHAVSMWPEGENKAPLAKAIRARVWGIEQEGRPEQGTSWARPNVPVTGDYTPVSVVYAPLQREADLLAKAGALQAIATATAPLFSTKPPARPDVPKMLTVAVRFPDEENAG